MGLGGSFCRLIQWSRTSGSDRIMGGLVVSADVLVCGGRRATVFVKSSFTQLQPEYFGNYDYSSSFSSYDDSKSHPNCSDQAPVHLTLFLVLRLLFSGVVFRICEVYWPFISFLISLMCPKLVPQNFPDLAYFPSESRRNPRHILLLSESQFFCPPHHSKHHHHLFA